MEEERKNREREEWGMDMQGDSYNIIQTLTSRHSYKNVWY
jgi:hypothetical protein